MYINLFLPVVMIADFIAVKLQSGCADLRVAATPETCGHDMDVPLSKKYGLRRLSPSKYVGLLNSVNAASISTPGAVTSG